MATTQEIAIRIKADGAQAQAALRGLGQSISSLKTSLTGIAAGFISFQTVRTILDTATAADRLSKSFATLKGSTAAAAREIEFVRSIAGKLGLPVNEAANAYLKLAASANGTVLEGRKTRDIFTAVARAASALGLSGAETEGALLAISQMMSKGTVSAEELRGQLGERLPGAFQIAARAMGVTTAELGKMLEQGGILAEDFLPKFAAELDKTFANARFDGIQQNINRIDTAWENLKKSIAERIDMAHIVAAAAEAAQKIDAIVRKDKQSQLEFVQAELNQKTQRLHEGGEFPGASILKRGLEKDIADLKNQAHKLAEEIARATEPLGSIANVDAGQAPALFNEVGRNRKKSDEHQQQLKKQEAAINKLLAQSEIELARAKGDTRHAAELEAAQLEGATEEQRNAFIAKQLEIEAARDSAGKRKPSTDTADDARQIAEANLSQQREFLALEEDALKASFDRKEIDAESYHQRLAALRDADFAAQIEAKRQEIALTADRGEQAKILAGLAILEAKRAASAQSAAQDLIGAREQEKQQVETLLDAYDQEGAALRRLQDDARKLAEFYRRGLITPEQAATASTGISERWKEVVEGTRDATDQMSKFAQRAAENMQDAFADFLFDPFKDGLSGMLKGFLDTIRRMAAEALSAEIFDALLGTKDKKGERVGGALSGIFGGIFGGDAARRPTDKTPIPPPAPVGGEQALVAAGTGLVPDTFFQGLQADFTTGLEGVRSNLSAAGGGIGSFFGDLGDLFMQGLKGLGGLLSGLLSSLSNAGSGIASGLSSLFSGLGGLFGFAAGGYTGNGGASQPAGVVHGREYVFSAPAVQALGVDFLNSLHAAGGRRSHGIPYQTGGLVQAASAAAQPSGVNALRLVLIDERQNPADYLSSAEGERSQLVNIQRNAHTVRQILGI